MNPRDYDIDELQGAPGAPGIANDDATDGTGLAGDPLRPDDVVRSNQFRELLLLEHMSSEDLEKPYLDELPQSYAAELTVFEWLEFLMSKGGIRGTIDALQYYESMDWVTREVEDRLQDYLRSIEEPDEGSDLERTDHVLSLVYIARLTSMVE